MSGGRTRAATRRAGRTTRWRHAAPVSGGPDAPRRRRRATAGEHTRRRATPRGTRCVPAPSVRPAPPPYERRPGAACPPLSPSYRRREPENTLLFRVVAAELDGLRADLAAASPYGSGLPKHVVKDLEGFLRCGILEHGFCRVVCRRCRAEHLVAFSCKGRICPSCNVRRMHDSAAAMVDRVLPRCPFRQWVTTFPRRIRYHLAADPKLATEALREVTRALFAWQRKRARAVGARPARAHSNGAITMVQRFNSALELSLHYHSLLPDGVFVTDGDDPDARPRFVAIDPPTNEEVAALLDQIIGRVTALLRRRGRLDDAIDDEPEPHLLLAARPAQRSATASPFVAPPLPPQCARKDGFSLHAGVAVHENDREGLERLARYCLRPPLAEGRLTEAPDGTLRYAMKRQFSDGRQVLSFEPRAFVLRLCALVPPRRFHMIRYAGLFSGHARGRYALTGRGLHDAPVCLPPPATASSSAATPATATPLTSGEQPAAVVPTLPPRASGAAAPVGTAPSAWPRPPRPADLAGPDDAGRERRLPWAVLLRRTWGLATLTCPRCGDRMEFIAAIEDADVARRILLHLGLPARAPPRGRPWRRQLGLPHHAGTSVGGADGLDPPSAFE